MLYIYKIADVVFGADIKYKYTYNILKDYLADQSLKPDFIISTTEEELETEISKAPNDFAKYAFESTAIYRKFIYELIEKYDGFFFHCSSVSVEDKAVMFTAKSGTGKSFHRRLWQKNFGSNVVVINDDKPVIRRIDGIYYVYGTPWCGKEGLGTNTKVPAYALCFLYRSDTNSIIPSDRASLAFRLLNQTLMPADRDLTVKLLDLLDGFVEQVQIYDLKVNMSDEAAIMAYNKIINTK